MIVALGGYARSGKDTLGGMMVSDGGFKRLAFADPLKGALIATDPYISTDGVRLSDALSKMGWDELKASEYGPEVRRLLQFMGTEGMRGHVGEDVWVSALTSKIVEEPGQDWVVTDVRMRNELEGLKSLGAITVWVSRLGVGPVNAHVSDSLLGESDFALSVSNDGTVDELYNEFTRVLTDFVVQ